MTPTFVIVIAIGFLVLFSAAVMVASIGFTGPVNARRSILAPIGVIASVVLAIALTAGMPLVDGTHVHNIAVSQKEAAAVAVYANTVKIPTTPLQANDVMTVATNDVATRDNVKITFSRFAEYRYDVVSSSSVGTNVSSVCVSFSPTTKTWSSSSSSCGN